MGHAEPPRPATAPGPAGRVRQHLFPLWVGGVTGAVALFGVVQRSAWPPHEDEALALLTGRESLGELVRTVLGERGGAPLHFLLAWSVDHLGGGLIELRLVSTAFAVASVPTIATLAARLAGRSAAALATGLVCASWVFLFNGVFGRMYSLFLFTSTLSYLALTRALERGSRRAWSLWGLATLATVATHPYGALVLASQAVFVLARHRGRHDALLALAAVVALGIPFWRTDLVLAGRFDVGLGGGGDQLGAPLPVLRYLARTAGDLTVGYRPLLVPVLVVALFGAVRLARIRPGSAALTAAVIGVPAVAFVLATLGSFTSPESRHLIFALPFLSTLVATGTLGLARGRRSALAVPLALVLLVPAELGWAWHKTPQLFAGEAARRVEARRAASAWLARSGSDADVLFGYDPLFLGAWERRSEIVGTVLPRADPQLALRALRRAPRPLGRGVWVLDASDSSNERQRLTIPRALPDPASEFETRVFGPFLVIRSRRPTGTPQRFLSLARDVMQLGRDLRIRDAEVNLETVVRTQNLARYEGSRSSSVASR